MLSKIIHKLVALPVRAMALLASAALAGLGPSVLPGPQ
jgi:hypothetical protein